MPKQLWLAFALVACSADLSPSRFQPPTRDAGAPQGDASGSNVTTGSASTTGSGETSGGGGASAGGAGGASGAAGNSPIDATGGAAGAIDASRDTPTGDAEDAATRDIVMVNCAGHALDLGGAGYLQTSRIVQDDFTLEAWIKTSTTSLTGTNFYEGNGLLYADVGGPANDFGSSILNDHFAFGVGNPDTTIQSFSAVTTGQWVHVAATRNKSTGEIQILVNGQLEASMTVAQTSSLTAPTMLTIGANTIDGRYFTGVIDEIRIWNVVRTEAEIASTLHKTLDGTDPGLVTYYRLDESDGTFALDGSPSKNDATLSGGTWVLSDAPICP